MSKPKILIDPQPRTMNLIFDAEAQRKLSNLAELTVFDAGPMPIEMIDLADVDACVRLLVAFARRGVG